MGTCNNLLLKDNKLNINIEILRVLSILIVVGYHYFPNYFPNGYLGVDVFLVISGYLIAKILARTDKDLNLLLLFFYKRCRRIIPSLTFMMLIMALFASVIHFENESQNLREAFWPAITLTSNFYFKNFNDYFAPSSQFQFLIHTWSLSIEMQFYLIIAILHFFFKSNKHIIILFIFSILTYHIIKLNNQTYAFFSTELRIWEFLFGYLIFTHYSKIMSVFKYFENLKSHRYLFIFLLSIILISIIKMNSGYFLNIIICFLSALVLITNQSTSSYIIKISKLGKYAFNLYLWHWPILVVSKYLIPNEIGSFFLLIIIILSCVISFIAHHLIEIRFRLKRNIILKNKIKIKLIHLVPFFLWLIFSNIFVEGKTQVILSNGSLAIKSNKINKDFEQHETANKECLEFMDINVEEYFFNFCVKNNLNPPEIILIGDSHVHHFYYGFNKLVLANIIHVGACDFSIIDNSNDNIYKTISDKHPCIWENIKKINNKILDKISFKELNKIIIINLGMEPMKNYDAIETKINKFFVKHNKIFVSLPFVYPKISPYTCIERRLFRTSKCQVKEEIKFDNVIEFIKKFNSKNQIQLNQFRIDNVYCKLENRKSFTTKLCDFKIKDKTLFLDMAGHLSKFGSIKITNNIINIIHKKSTLSKLNGR